MDLRSLPQTLETDDLPKKKLDKIYHPPTPELIAYLDFSISTTGVLSGVKVYITCFVNIYTRVILDITCCCIEYV